MDFRILGPIEAVRAGRPVRLAGPQQRSVLAALLLARGRMVSVDRLVRLLWAERPPATARTQLRKRISGLRASLGADRIRSWRDGYALRVAPGELDLDRFLDEVRRADLLLRAGRAAEASDALTAGLGWWRGPALADGTDELTDAEAPQLEEARLAAVEQRVAARLALCHHPQVVGELVTLVRRHPYRERLRGQLMLALHHSGRTADGLGVYRDWRAELSAQLAIEPGRELRDLHRALLSGDVPC
ncbi:AfsR/SARP family transcriptional regulator [Micromonospora sp. LAH09]|uniref:AfsR/SARP family transcriptional regulator n=1 Tax=Micromonospora cabrerizensis TaxID=2911213 RepID=UPI001EE90412|nr:AfsR/SARP family transcriptional regulator [Micromonospora cabrerizensis]MCG5468206.1 AfsR/SARP family transcriptional regulator [Micromonospora cabrerizensis]